MPHAQATAPGLSLTTAVRRYRDGSRVETADVPGFFVAVTPRGTRLRDSGTRLVMLYRLVEDAAADLASLGYGPGTIGEVVVKDNEFMPCDHPGCTKGNDDLTHDRTVWVRRDHLKVEYFCAEHAPADASPIEED